MVESLGKVDIDLQEYEKSFTNEEIELVKLMTDYLEQNPACL